MKFNEIKLLPSLWTLDVLISDDNDANIKAVSKRYGMEYYDFNGRCMDEVYSIDSGKDSIMKGERRILLVLRNLDNIPLLIHELTHVLWHYSYATAAELNYESQEWQAMFMEHICREILKLKK